MGNSMWEAEEFIYDAEKSITVSADRARPVVYLNFVDEDAWSERNISYFAFNIGKLYSKFKINVVTEKPTEGDFYTVCIGTGDALRAYAESEGLDYDPANPESAPGLVFAEIRTDDLSNLPVKEGDPDRVKAKVLQSIVNQLTPCLADLCPGIPVVYLNFVDKDAWSEGRIASAAELIAERYNQFEFILVTEPPVEGEFYTVCIGTGDALRAYAESEGLVYDPENPNTQPGVAFAELKPENSLFFSLDENGVSVDTMISIGDQLSALLADECPGIDRFSPISPTGPSISTWSIIGRGDFNGNGQDGLLWLNRMTGEVFMQNNMIYPSDIFNQSNLLGVVEEGCTVKGIGDFSGSGLSGVLLQTAFGTQNYGLAVWARDNDGTMFTGWLGALVNTWQEGDALQGDLNDSADINAKNSRYNIVGIADFNGDGIDDVMIRNTMPGSIDGHAVTGSGDVFVFLTGDKAAVINGDAPTAAYAGKITGDWEIVGFGDFNGDGTADVLFSDGTSLAGWQISNGQRTADLWFGTLGAGETFAGISDVNGDGTADIVLSNDEGTSKYTAWTVRDGAVTGALALGYVSL